MYVCDHQVQNLMQSRGSIHIIVGNLLGDEVHEGVRESRERRAMR